MNTPEEKLLERPIVILGAPRSGTTLLGSVLANHPHLAYVEEPRLSWMLGNSGRSDFLRPVDARPEVVRDIRRALCERVRQADRTRLLEKTPSNSLRGGFVDRVLPDALYVHILRNGFDAALSIRAFTTKHSTGAPRNAILKRIREMKLRQAPGLIREGYTRLAPAWARTRSTTPTWGPRLPGMADLVRDLSPLQVACLQWRACVEAACHFGRTLPTGRYLELNLEQMDEEKLQQIMRFCDLPFSEEVVVDFRRRFRPRDPSARNGTASAEERDEIQRWITPTVEWLAAAPGQD